MERVSYYFHLSGARMTGWYICGDDGHDIGPFSNERFLSLADNLDIDGDITVRHEHHTKGRWVAASQIRKFRERRADAEVFEADAVDVPHAAEMPERAAAAPKCPYCGSTVGFHKLSKVTPVGMVFFVVMLLFLCLPLCWIGLLIKETHTYCRACGMKVG